MTVTGQSLNAVGAPGERVVVRALQEKDLAEADRIMRLAFGTYLGAPDPGQVFGDADWVHTRYKADPEFTLVIGLHVHHGNTGEPFSEAGTGLDHASLSVPDRAALSEWQRLLEQKGVPHSTITDAPYGSVLVFRDPDNIQLEFFAPPTG